MTKAYNICLQLATSNLYYMFIKLLIFKSKSNKSEFQHLPKHPTEQAIPAVKTTNHQNSALE